MAASDYPVVKTPRVSDPLSNFKEGIRPGTLLKERYLVEQELGRGGIGIVYLARDQQLLSKPVVVKVLQETATDDQWIRNKFGQELESLARIDHPGVVGVIDYGELPSGEAFIVMQHVEGSTLEAELRQGPFAVDRAVNILRQICLALNAAHSKGVIHRDLKPQNIMIQNFGNGEEAVKIIDFGIAKVRNSQIATSTKENITAGTLLYMAPEQIREKTNSVATDIWSVGVIGYEMLTGSRPFEAQSEADLYEKQKVGLKRPPSSVRSEIPKRIEEIILKSLSFDPKTRSTSASDMARELTAAPDQKILDVSSDMIATRQTSFGGSSEALQGKPTSVFRSISPKRLAVSFAIVIIFASLVWLIAKPGPIEEIHVPPKAPPEQNPGTESPKPNPPVVPPMVVVQSPKPVEPSWMRKLPANDPNVVDVGIFALRSDRVVDPEFTSKLLQTLSSKGTISELSPDFSRDKSSTAIFEGDLSGMPENEIDMLHKHVDYLLFVSHETEFSQVMTYVVRASVILKYRLIDLNSQGKVFTSSVSDLGSGHTNEDANQQATERAITKLVAQVQF